MLRHRLSFLLFLTIAVLQLYTLFRYIRRLPDDYIGITIFAITIVLLLFIATLSYFRYKRDQHKKDK